MSWQAPGYAHRLELGGGKTGRAFLAANEESGELVVDGLVAEPAREAGRLVAQH